MEQPDLSGAELADVEPQNNRVLSGFWRRVAAFLVDSIFLGLLGFLLGIFFRDYFMGLGPQGRAVGLVIALLYFGILNSTIGKGRTLGKCLLRIEVVNKEGNHISPLRSFLRYLILAVPFFLNGWWLPISSMRFVISCIISFMVFGVSISTIYLLVFNRRTRQSVHDLITGTYVVRTLSGGAVQARPVWKFHLFVVSVICLLAIGVVFLPSVINLAPLSDLTEVQKHLQGHEKVHNATAFVGKSWFVQGGKSSENTYFQSRVYWKNKPEDYESAAQEIAALIFESYPQVNEKDRVIITISTGYDIGIASAWESRTFAYSPSEWRTKLSRQNQSL